MAGGVPKKLPTARQGHGAATKDVALKAEQPPIPIPPKGLTRRTRQRWMDAWGSQVARAWDPVADLHVVERYFRAVDEYERVLPEFQKERVTTGSTGQLVIHPLAGYLAQREAVMKTCEGELGLTPMSRTRLGIALGEQKLTAIELNRRLNQAPSAAQIERAANEDVIEGDWIDA